MKVCGNAACQAIHSDDYEGQCPHCGRPMGGESGGSASPTLAWNPLAQIAQAQAEERSIQNRDHSNMRIAPGLMATAREFVIGPPDA